jgi:hypothetical protein
MRRDDLRRSLSRMSGFFKKLNTRMDDDGRTDGWMA